MMQVEAINGTSVSEFELDGFFNLGDYGILLFAIFLVTYLLILSANALILSLISATPRLHVPMYFFIAVLATLEVFYTTITMPRVLVDLLRSKKSISFRSCLLQIYFFHSVGISEACLLAVMAYDRYLAICAPLNYMTKMTPQLCIQLVLGCCVCGFACPLPEIVLTSRLPFCGPSHIDHIFCDFPQVISLACTDILTSIMLDFALHTIAILALIFLILLSYMKILKVIVKISSSEGRQKAFSTCASHLIVVFTFFGTTGFMYMHLTWMGSGRYDKIVAVIYAFFIPLFNPIIYSLRNKEIRDVIRKTVGFPCASNI
ncbi:olfactory receptor 6N2-like [Podarcis raffonei]|uniref:olfactory receptor 6N2-like n=1 Tax=Podarcis raffonei TaxID=65483 RepID=UPI0023297F05|nr:olfactory receptor 6N2-like [Podarcis raffonei]